MHEIKRVADRHMGGCSIEARNPLGGRRNTPQNTPGFCALHEPGKAAGVPRETKIERDTKRFGQFCNRFRVPVLPALYIVMAIWISAVLLRAIEKSAQQSQVFIPRSGALKGRTMSDQTLHAFPCARS